MCRFPRNQLISRVNPDNLEDMKAFFYSVAWKLPSEWKTFEVIKSDLDISVLAELKYDFLKSPIEKKD